LLSKGDFFSNETYYLEQAIKMHSALIAETGGLDGVRDMNLLDGSVNSPYHTFGGQNLYPTI
jgi:death-on-curing protein